MFKPISRKYFSNVTWTWYAWNVVDVFKALCGIGFVLHTYYQCSLKKYFRYPITFLKYTLLKKSWGKTKPTLTPGLLFILVKLNLVWRIECNVYNFYAGTMCILAGKCPTIDNDLRINIQLYYWLRIHPQYMHSLNTIVQEPDIVFLPPQDFLA